MNSERRYNAEATVQNFKRCYTEKDQNMGMNCLEKPEGK